MNYLRDNRLASGRRKRRINGGIFAGLLILAVMFFHKPIFSFFSTVFMGFGLPIWSASNTVSEDISYLFDTKKSLMAENQDLKDQILASIAEAADRNVLLEENLRLKEILDRKGSPEMALGVILAKPNKSPYDTLIVDIGAENYIKEGSKVFAYGNILIGEVDKVYLSTSSIKLFSTAGEAVDVVLGNKNTYVQAKGRGGQNFEITMPRDIEVEKGTEAVFPGIHPYVLATVEEIISDARDPFQKLLLRSPINIQDLKFVEVETQK